MEDVEIVYEPHDINCEGNGCMWKISLENVDNFDVTHMQYVMDFLSSISYLSSGLSYICGKYCG